MDRLFAGAHLSAGQPLGFNGAGEVVPLPARPGGLLRWWDRQGQEVFEVLEWATLLGDRSYRQVALDHFVSPTRTVMVSTIWDGIDGLALVQRRTPLIFETYVEGARGWRDGITVRWPNEATALRGHRLLCEAMRLDWSRRRLQRELDSLSWAP